MKFSQRLFIVLMLLGFFHNSFAQAGIHLNSPMDSPHQEMHKDSLPDQQHSSQHDCCDESTDKMVSSHICQFCGEDCQCQNDCHVSTANIVLITTRLNLTRSSPVIVITPLDSPLFSVYPALEKRPPRFA